MDVDDDKEPNPGKKKQVNVFLRDQERNVDDAGTNDGLAMLPCKLTPVLLPMLPMLLVVLWLLQVMKVMHCQR